MKLSELYLTPLELSLMEILIIMDSNDVLSEGIMSKLLDKTGMKLTRGTSLFGYIKSASMGIASILVAAIRGDKDRIKEIMSTISKNDLIDFLMKLDASTMGLITGPIRMIEAITGWGISANINVMKSASTAAKSAIATVKSNIRVVMNKTKAKLYTGYLAKIEKELT